MSAPNIISEIKQQDELADDGLSIPNFFKLTAADRRPAWERNPSRPLPAFGREMTATERAYRASIELDKAVKRARDEVRFRQLRAKAAAEKAERAAVQLAVKQRQREERRGVGRHHGVGRDRQRAGAGTRVRRAT